MSRCKKHIVIIGGGHNGLIAAAYLAEKHRVSVFESRHILGGCASTEELWPGFKVSPAAYVVSLLDKSIIDDLKLRQNGFRLLNREPSSYTPDLNGPGLILGSHNELNVHSISKYSDMDAQRFVQYEEHLDKFARMIEPFLHETPPAFASQRKSKISKLISFLGLIGTTWKCLDTDSKTSFQDLLRFLSRDAASLLDIWFSADILKATLATDAVIGAFRAPTHPGTAYILLHHVMGNATGDRGIWGYVEGGMGELASALGVVCRLRGVEIYRDHPVSEIHVANNSAYEVVVNDSWVKCDAVVSSVDAKTTFNKLLGICTNLYDLCKDTNRIDYSSASAKINLALDALPNFIGNYSGRCNGTIHIAPTMAYIERAYYGARFNSSGMSDELVLEITIPSVVDSTIAPVGKHIMSIFIQYVAYQGIKDKAELQARRDCLFDKVVKIIEMYAPGFEKLILHSQVLLPEDLERTYGLTGGNIFQGAMNFSNLFMTRPSMECCDYRTPVKGLYLCGAATHPGGGVMGLAGKNAAREILKDL